MVNCYPPININMDFPPFNLSNTNSENWMILNDNVENLDCFGISNGLSECDDCGICDGENLDMDNCEICFGNNIDLDCNNTCFGMSYEDGCGVCDD